MDPILKKLNARPGVPVTMLDAPPEMAPFVEGWGQETVVHHDLGVGVRFLLGFVHSASQVADRAAHVVPLLADDAVLWFAYPKRSSKRYRSDLSQMQGWHPLGELGFEAVRQVSLDDDWSALRFRRAEHITTMRRQASMAISEQGKRRVADP